MHAEIIGFALLSDVCDPWNVPFRNLSPSCESAERVAALCFITLQTLPEGRCRGHSSLIFSVTGGELWERSLKWATDSLCHLHNFTKIRHFGAANFNDEPLSTTVRSTVWFTVLLTSRHVHLDGELLPEAFCVTIQSNKHIISNKL